MVSAAAATLVIPTAAAGSPPPISRDDTAKSSDTVGGILYALAPNASTVYAVNVSTGARRWSTVIPNAGGTLVVSGGSVYVIGGNGLAAEIYALNATNGAIAWKRMFAGVSNPSSPALADNLLYIAFWQSPIKPHSPAVCAVHTSGGSLAWCQKLSSDPLGNPPAVDSGHLYVSERNRIEGFSASNGHRMWSQPVNATSGPAVDPGTAVVVAGTYSHVSQVLGLNPSTGAVLWKQKITGLYLTPLVVAGGTVYLSAFDSTVYALNAASGSKLWSVDVHDSFVPSLLVDQGVVYVGGTTGSGGVNNIRALNGSTGQQLWRWSTTGNGGAIPLAVSNGILAASQGEPDGLFALNPSTGMLRWAYPTDRGVDGSPAVAGSTVFAGSEDTRLYALHTGGGSKAWAAVLGGPVDFPPVKLGATIFAVTAYPDNSIHALKASTGKQIWFHAFRGDLINAAPIVSAQSVFVATSDRLYAFNPSTGAVRWIHRTPPAAEVYGSLALAGGDVFACSTANAHANVTAFNASNGHPIWSFPTRGGDGPMAIKAGVLYIPGRNRVFALRATTGESIWTRTTSDTPFPSLALAGHMVYVGSQNSNVYALSTSDGRQLWKRHVQGVPYSLAVSGSTLFAGGDHIVALKAATGHEVWTSSVDDGMSVTVYGGNVYAGARGSRYGGIYKLNGKTGHLVWTFLTARSPL